MTAPELIRPSNVATSHEAVASSADDTNANKPTESKVLKPPPRRARTRGPIVSRFKGFDDDDQIVTAATPAQPDNVKCHTDSVGKNGRLQRRTVSSQVKT